MNGLPAELTVDHILEHVTDPDSEPDARKAERAREPIDVRHPYMK
ncbi:metal-sensitive transcriptional regulator [Salipiger thiooxidans]|nr:hypothetical protein [Salipiger thiooxidans]